jgi:hypothetical protein
MRFMIALLQFYLIAILPKNKYKSDMIGFVGLTPGFNRYLV